MADWKTIVKTVAPALGAALGGPLIGSAIATIGAVLLPGKTAPSVDEVAAAVCSASPEALLALKKADAEFAVKMKEMEIDVFRLEVEDRKSARELFTVNYWPQIVLSTVFIVGYFIVLVTVMNGKVAAEVGPSWQPVLNTILGVLTASIPTILAFWFGSSFGSREKTAALAASSPAQGAKGE